MNLRRLLLAWFVVAGVMFFAPAPRATAAPCAPTTSGVSVAVVVDFGDGSPASAVCVPADSSDNGAAVLAARAEQLDTPAPRFDSSGFVCGIDGYPSSGCGEQSGATYAYWSYWHGTGGSASWEYSNVGPGGSRVHADVVEGWRFQPHGAGNPTDPPPNGSPDHNAICLAPTTTIPNNDPPTTEATADTAPMGVVAPSTTTTTGAATTATTATSATTVTSASASATTTTSPSRSQVAAGPVRVTEPTKHSSPWPAVGAGVVIAGLVGGGVFAARRRNQTGSM